MTAIPLFADADVSSFFLPILGMLVIIALLIGAIAVIRKYMMAPTHDEASPAGFSLGSLRQLVRDGKMSQEEFDKAKAQIIAATQRATDRKAADLTPAPEPKTTLNDPH